MLSKSLIQFSVDGRGCVPSLLFDLKPNYGGDMKIMATSFKRSHAYIATLSAPSSAAGGPRGAMPRSGVAAERNYPASKIRNCGCTLLKQP